MVGTVAAVRGRPNVADVDCEEIVEYRQEARVVYLHEVGHPNGMDGPNKRLERQSARVAINGLPDPARYENCITVA